MPPGSADRAGFLARGQTVLREVARAGLARFADAFVEEGAFGQDEVRPFLEKARILGLGLKLHVDQLRAGRGAEFAASLGAISADHLESVDAEGIAALVRARVTAVLIPTATLVLRLRRYAPGRALVDAGVGVARAPNCTPGSAPPRTSPSRLAGLPAERAHPGGGPLGVTRRGGEALGDTSLVGWVEDRRTWWCSVHPTSTTRRPRRHQPRAGSGGRAASSCGPTRTPLLKKVPARASDETGLEQGFRLPPTTGGQNTHADANTDPRSHSERAFAAVVALARCERHAARV
jgi:hypothetical protein